MSAVDDLARKVRSYFEGINQKVFAGDPAANPDLEVELVSATFAHDTPVLVLATPWTLIGLAFPPDGKMPSSLRLGANNYSVIANEVLEIGAYFSILLVPDVSGYSAQDELVATARLLADKLHSEVEKVRTEMTQVVDGDRRALFKAVKGTPPPGPRVESPFGNPDGPPVSGQEA